MSFQILLSAVLLHCVIGENNYIPVSDFVEVNASVKYIEPLFYIDQGRKEELLCPTLSLPHGAIVLEPFNNTNGNFSYKPDNSSLCIRHNRYGCHNPSYLSRVCDQLIITPKRFDIHMVLEVWYNTTTPFHQKFTFSFGPPEIIYDGRLPIVIYRNRPQLTFNFRPTNSDGVDVCDIDNNNSTSSFLDNSPLFVNMTCIPSRRLPMRSDLLQVMVSVINLDESFTKMVKLVQGKCPGSASTLSSPIYTVTYMAEEGPASPPITSTSEVVTPPTNNGSHLSTGAIIGIVCGVVAVVTVVVILVGVIVCIRCYKSKMKTDGDSPDIGMTLASDEQKCVKVNEEDKPPDTTERLQNGSCVQVEVIQNPPEGIQHLPKGIQHPPEGIQHPPKGIQHPPKGIEHPPEGIQHPPEATSPSTKLTKPRELSNPSVKTIAFVTPPEDSTTNFTILEDELLRLHNCDRLSDGQPLVPSDKHLRICQLLIGKKDCLVYIMWHGKLEDMQPHTYIKQIVKLFSSRPPLLNSSQASVMNRLVFLQIGSKDTADCSTLPSDSTWVSYKLSPMDKQFDAKKCGEEVYEKVRTKLEAQPGPPSNTVILEAQPEPPSNTVILDQIQELGKEVAKGFKDINKNQRFTNDLLAEKQLETDQYVDEDDYR